jgi:hypothetical protein
MVLLGGLYEYKDGKKVVEVQKNNSRNAVAQTLLIFNTQG